MAQVSACNHTWKFTNKKEPGKKLDCIVEEYEVGRDRVRLGLGALKGAMHVWGLARRSVREVVGISRDLLTASVKEYSLGSGDSRDNVSKASD